MYHHTHGITHALYTHLWAEHILALECPSTWQNEPKYREAYRNWETKGQPLGLDWFGQAIIPFQFEVWSIPLSKMIAIASEFVPKDLAFATSYWLGKKSYPSATCSRAPHLVLCKHFSPGHHIGLAADALDEALTFSSFGRVVPTCHFYSIHLHILSANVSMQLVFQTHCTCGCWTCRSLLPRWYATCHLYTKIGQFPWWAMFDFAIRQQLKLVCPLVLLSLSLTRVGSWDPGGCKEVRRRFAV